jgi:hypothetical protein
MNASINTLLADKIVKRSLTASTVLLIITLIFAALLFRNLPPFIPVFNQLPWGMERLGDRIYIFYPLLIAVGIFGGNLIFSQILYGKMPLVVRMISITTFFISFITCIFILRTILLII